MCVCKLLPTISLLHHILILLSLPTPRIRSGTVTIVLWNFNSSAILSNVSEDRWNYFKGNYEQMKKTLDLEWDKILNDSNPNKLFNIFGEKFNSFNNGEGLQIIC